MGQGKLQHTLGCACEQVLDSYGQQLARLGQTLVVLTIDLCDIAVTALPTFGKGLHPVRDGWSLAHASTPAHPERMQGLLSFRNGTRCSRRCQPLTN